VSSTIVAQPRISCFKSNLNFDRDDMAKRFLASHRNGFYLRVLREGEVGAGDEIVSMHADENRVSVLDALRLYLHESGSSELLHRALRVEYLSAVLCEEFSQVIWSQQHANKRPSYAAVGQFPITGLGRKSRVTSPLAESIPADRTAVANGCIVFLDCLNVLC
jgi:hypothetical protein